MKSEYCEGTEVGTVFPLVEAGSLIQAGSLTEAGGSKRRIS